MMHGHHSAVFSVLVRKICSTKLIQGWVDVLWPLDIAKFEVQRAYLYI